MRITNLIILTILLVVYVPSVKGQKMNEVSFDFQYGPDIPKGDMGKLFGLSFSPRIGLDYYYNNWIFGFHGQFTLGNIVKQDIIKPLRNSDGLLISQQKSGAIVTPKQRGSYLGFHTGKIIALGDRQGRHNLRIVLGTGLFSRHIKFNDETLSTVQLTNGYHKGYDRLTKGIAFDQFIGYQYHLGNQKTFLYCGIQALESFSKSIRPVNFDTGTYGGANLLDYMFSVKVGFSIRLYEFSRLQEADEIYY